MKKQDDQDAMKGLFNSEQQQQIREEEIHQKEREVLFGNEAFVIGMLQVVSGGGLLASLSGAKGYVAFLYAIPLVVFLTFLGLALMSSVLAAYFRHQYKMWHVKQSAYLQLAIRDKDESAANRSIQFLVLSQKRLTDMRRFMRFSVIMISAGIVWLLLCVWWTQLFT